MTRIAWDGVTETLAHGGANLVIPEKPVGSQRIDTRTPLGWRVTIEPALVGWKWEVYHSGYGLAYGHAMVKKRARRYAKEAVADFVSVGKEGAD